MNTISAQIVERPDLHGEDEGVKRIVVIVGHPISGSLSHSLADRYVTTLRAEGPEALDVKVIDLAEQSVSPPLRPSREQLRARDSRDHLDAQVVEWIELVERADHLVWFFPQWWGTYPAVMKAFIDSVFLSGLAFTYDGRLPAGLWKGKTARVFATMDSPGWWNSLWYRNAMMASLNRAVLRYVGIVPQGFTIFKPVRSSTSEDRTHWLRVVARRATRDARSLADERGVSSGR